MINLKYLEGKILDNWKKSWNYDLFPETFGTV